MTSSSFVFANLVALRTDLSRQLDLRLRTDHDLPLEMYEVMTAIVAGEHTAVGIARRTATDESDAIATVTRLSARGLCLLEAESRSIQVRGLTIAGGYLFTHASAAFDDQLTIALGGPLSDEPATLLADILQLLLAVDRRTIDVDRMPRATSLGSPATRR